MFVTAIQQKAQAVPGRVRQGVGPGWSIGAVVDCDMLLSNKDTSLLELPSLAAHLTAILLEV